MKSSSLYLTLALFCVAAWGTAQARDLVVPAGTVMTCTLDEPKFSSATVTVGDPFLCYPRTMQSFGQVVFPRGTYLVGHLEGDKEPGHFVGKGYLKLAFDRIGLPSTDLPVTVKIIAVTGYKVDRQGKIIGHGHAKRDVVEWMLPPLWPWKVLTLPARGPRPTLKGETRLTLRVMDDIIVPQTTTPGWHRFGEPSSYVSPPPQPAQPNAVVVISRPAPSLAEAVAAQRALRAADTAAAAGCQQPMLLQPITVQPGVAVAQARSPVTAKPSLAKAWAPNVTLFVLADGTVFPATQYWLDRDQLLYVSDGDKGAVALGSVDWSTTTKINVARNVRVILRNTPATPDLGAN